MGAMESNVLRLNVCRWPSTQTSMIICIIYGNNATFQGYIKKNEMEYIKKGTMVVAGGMGPTRGVMYTVWGTGTWLSW